MTARGPGRDRPQREAERPPRRALLQDEGRGQEVLCSKLVTFCPEPIRRVIT